jgi:hypothetical protein
MIRPTLSRLPGVNALKGTETDFGLRREAKRHAALARTDRVGRTTHLARSKAVSPLCSATAIQNAQPEGLPEISRGLRNTETIPPVREEMATTQKGSQRRVRFGCDGLHPSRVQNFAGRLSGGVALLNPRLMSGIAPRCDFHDVLGTNERNGNLFDGMKELIEIRSRVRK